MLRLYDPDDVVAVLAAAGFAVEVGDGYGEHRFGPGWHVFTARKR